MNHRKDPDKTFFGLLINPKVPSLGLSSTWYQLKLSWHYFKRFFYDIWWFRGSDRDYTLSLLETALKEHLRVISTLEVEGLDEIDETRIPKENAIKRCLELIRNIREDNFADRCGYDYNYDFDFEEIEDKEGYSRMTTTATPEQEANNDRALKESYVLYEKEHDELFEILKNKDVGLMTWWK